MAIIGVSVEVRSTALGRMAEVTSSTWVDSHAIPDANDIGRALLEPHSLCHGAMEQ